MIAQLRDENALLAANAMSVDVRTSLVGLRADNADLQRKIKKLKSGLLRVQQVGAGSRLTTVFYQSELVDGDDHIHRNSFARMRGVGSHCPLRARKAYI